MKYLCLVYLEDDKLHAVRDSECLAASERLRAEGRVVAAEALHPVHTATTLPSARRRSLAARHSLSRTACSLSSSR